jgi:MFS family permease
VRRPRRLVALVAGRLKADRVLLAGLSVFTLASLAGGLVDDGTLLVLTRFLKGASAAFTAPAGLSIITTTFTEGPARNRALSIYTATGASGFSLGLVFGGLLTELGWRWTFLLPVPVALGILFAVPRLIRPDRPDLGARRRYDLPGAVTDAAPYALTILPTMLLIGVGFALCFPSLNMQATAGIADHEQGLASGLVNTPFQVGGALALAVVSAVASGSGDIVDAYRTAIAVVLGVAVLGLVVALAGIVPDRGQEAYAEA